MKLPRPRIHVLYVSEPLLAYSNIVVCCELTLKNATPLYMCEQGIADEIKRPFGICLACKRNQPTVRDESTRYEYGLMNSEEAKSFTEEGES